MRILKTSDLQVPERAPDGHKGTFGRVLVIAGSPGMSGAAALTGSAALRGGAGLVTVACPASVQPEVAGHNACYTTVALECDSSGQMAIQSDTLLRDLIDGRDAIAIGPGLGLSPAVVAMIRGIMSHASCPLVLDADALNVAAESRLFNDRNSYPKCVITPHPGEFSRLTGLSVTEITGAREAHAASFAVDTGLTVVLKGPGTVVTDGTEVYVNTTGNAGMATGGSGDVLTGILVAQLAQGLPPIKASAISVFIHGLAGDLAANSVSQQSLIATDLLNYLGPAWLHFAAIRSNQ